MPVASQGTRRGHDVEVARQGRRYGRLEVRRGDIVTIVLPGACGKPRPALVIQSDYFSALGSVTVLPADGPNPGTRSPMPTASPASTLTYPSRSDQARLRRWRPRAERQLRLMRLAVRAFAVDLDAEHALQAPCPTHRHMRRSGRFDGTLFRLRLVALASTRRRHRCAQLAVRGKHAVEPRQVHPWRAAPGPPGAPPDETFVCTR